MADEALVIPMHLVLPNQKAILEGQLKKFQMGVRAWMFGLRIQPAGPLKGKQVYHGGLDMPAPVDTPIMAPWDWECVKAWFDPPPNDEGTGGYGGGNSIVLVHKGAGIAFPRTGYCHLNEFKVKVGMKGKAGDIIGLVGNTGVTTGPHLHFTARAMVNGKLTATDPLGLLCAAAGVVEMPMLHPVDIGHEEP